MIVRFPGLYLSLKSFGWPFIQIGETNKVQETSKSISIQEFQEIIKCLIMIEDDSEVSEVDNKDEMAVTHVMKIMLKPLRKRFKYHFLGTKTTNNPGKPEWFTTQLVHWASLHKTFLEANVEPVYDLLELPVSAKIQFCYGLVCLAREKLGVDLPIVFSDDVLLAHTIDETISLTRDLCSQLEYSSAQPSPLAPLTVSMVFSRWINMERKFAFEKLDNVVVGENAWQSVVKDNLVPAAAQSFLSILLSVTERYKYLSHSEHRLGFLELQLQLQKKEGLTDEEMDGTVFDDVISKFEYLMSDMVTTIIDSVMFSVRATSRHYRQEVKWFSMTDVSENVHPSFCNILQEVAFYLETVVKMVPPQVFSRLWMELASEIGKFICEDVILVNNFNSGGAKQLQLDMSHGLLPIFGEFTTCPQAHFPILMDCVRLLNTASGSLILSLETLKTRNGEKTLAELNVSRLTVDQAVAVIQTRVDLEL